VLQESDNDHTRRDDADDGQRGRHDGKQAVPAHVLLAQSAAAASVVRRPPAAIARAARVLVLDVRVRIARRAHPAARVALLDAFDVADVARPTALRQRDVVRACNGPPTK